jgi:hypothetical protein
MAPRGGQSTDQTTPMLSQRADVTVAPVPFHALTGFSNGNEMLNHAALSAFMRDALSPYHVSANLLPLYARSGQLKALQPEPVPVERAPLALPGTLEPTPLSVPGSLLSGLASKDTLSVPPRINRAMQALGDPVVFREVTTSSSSLTTDSESLAAIKEEGVPELVTRALPTKRRRKTASKVLNSVKSTTSLNEGKAMIPYPSKFFV